MESKSLRKRWHWGGVLRHGSNREREDKRQLGALPTICINTLQRLASQPQEQTWDGLRTQSPGDPDRALP